MKEPAAPTLLDQKSHPFSPRQLRGSDRVRLLARCFLTSML